MLSIYIYTHYIYIFIFICTDIIFLEVSFQISTYVETHFFQVQLSHEQYIQISPLEAMLVDLMHFAFFVVCQTSMRSTRTGRYHTKAR